LCLSLNIVIPHYARDLRDKKETILRHRLTDLSVRKLPHPERGSVKYWDEVTPGFGVRCTARSKSFVVMYGQDRRLKTIGKYPEISLKDARTKAQKIALLEEPRKHVTGLHGAIAAYMAECEKKNRQATVNFYRHFLQGIKDKPLAEVKASDLKDPGSHQIMTWRVFFNWAIRNELTEKNPFAHQRVSYNKRDRVLSDDEIKAVWHYDAPPYSDMVKLLLLTGQRRGQIWKLDPQWCDDGLIHFPADIMKGGRSHTIPVASMAAALMEAAPFSFNSWAKSKKKMDAATGVTEWVLHDLRRSFATIHARLGTPIHVVEEYLAHRTGTISGVAAIYVRYDFLNEMKAASINYETHLRKLISQ